MASFVKSSVNGSETCEVILGYERLIYFTINMPSGISNSDRIKMIEKNLHVLDEDVHSDYTIYDFDIPGSIECRVLGSDLHDVVLEIKLDNGQYKLFSENELVD
jgi:hypothetical protein